VLENPVFQEHALMHTGTFQRLIAILEEAFSRLQVQVSPKKVEDLAITVHRAMTSHGRHFHTMEHVFMFVNPANPIQTLAGLYHDVVYYQVDLGFSPDIWNIIRSFIEFRDDEMHVMTCHNSADARLCMTLEVFGFLPGKQLSNMGDLNEFLSALVMNCELAGILSEKDLLRLTVCIEATIPFRGGVDARGGHFETMHTRLAHISTQRGIPFTEAEIEETMKLAVMFANKDIENFGEADPIYFIDNTWKLLPEMNIALRARDVYSIREYRQALQKMEVFLFSLDPDSVFNRYRDTPPEAEFLQMVTHARQNIRVACEYLQIKLLGLAILDALAQVTGGDAPLSLFVGDLPQKDSGNGVKRLEHFLPKLSPPVWIDPEAELYRLLYVRLDTDSQFDTRYAALSLYLYNSLATDTLATYHTSANEMFAEKISADVFLTQINCPTLIVIARACAEMVPTRRIKLLQYANSLSCNA
jgi:hypothetical protein